MFYCRTHVAYIGNYKTKTLFIYKSLGAFGCLSLRSGCWSSPDEPFTVLIPHVLNVDITDTSDEVFHDSLRLSEGAASNLSLRTRQAVLEELAKLQRSGKRPRAPIGRRWGLGGLPGQSEIRFDAGQYRRSLDSCPAF